MTSINSFTSETFWPAQFPYFRDWTHTVACRGRWAATSQPTTGSLFMPQLPPVEELKKPCAGEEIGEAGEQVPFLISPITLKILLKYLKLTLYHKTSTCVNWYGYSLLMVSTNNPVKLTNICLWRLSRVATVNYEHLHVFSWRLLEIWVVCFLPNFTFAQFCSQIPLAVLKLSLVSSWQHWLKPTPAYEIVVMVSQCSCRVWISHSNNYHKIMRNNHQKCKCLQAFHI